MKPATAAAIIGQHTIPSLSETPTTSTGQVHLEGFDRLIANIPGFHPKSRRRAGGSPRKFHRRRSGRGRPLVNPLSATSIRSCDPNSDDPDVGILSCDPGYECSSIQPVPWADFVRRRHLANCKVTPAVSVKEIQPWVPKILNSQFLSKVSPI